MSDNKFNFGKLKGDIDNFKRVVPILIANQAQNYFVSAFDKQAWDGVAWQQVKRRIPGTPEYKYPKTSDLGRRTRPILIGKGSTRLRRAVSQSVRIQTWPRVLLLVDLKYAQAHNEGNPSRNLPKRQYMGQTKELTVMQNQIIDRELAKLKG